MQHVVLLRAGMCSHEDHLHSPVVNVAAPIKADLLYLILDTQLSYFLPYQFSSLLQASKAACDNMHVLYMLNGAAFVLMMSKWGAGRRYDDIAAVNNAGCHISILTSP